MSKLMGVHDPHLDISAMFDSNDPRLTAFILGELDDASRRELEAELETSPEMRSTVEELRRAAEYLTSALEHEPAPSLTDQQRETIRSASRVAAEEAAAMAAADNNGETPSGGPMPAMKPAAAGERRPAWWFALASIAAVLLVGVVVVGGRQLFEDNVGESDVVATRNGSQPQDSFELGFDAKLNNQANPPHPQLGDFDAASSSPEMTERYSAEESLAYDPDPRSSDFTRAGGRGRGEASAGGSAPPPRSTAPATADAPYAPFGGPGLGGGTIGSGGFRGGYPARPGGDSRAMELAQAGERAPDADGAQFGDDADRYGAVPTPALRPSAPETSEATPSPAPSVPAQEPAEVEAQTMRNRTLPLSTELATQPASPAEPSAERGEGQNEFSRENRRPMLRGVPDDGGPEAVGLKPAEPAEQPPANAPVAGPEAPLGESAEPQKVASPEDRIAQRRQSGGQQGQGRDAEKAGKEGAERNEELDEAGAKDESRENRSKEVEDDKKNAPPVAKTWRRVNAVPNASRLVIGDRDELPLEGMQANVTIDGFRARVILDLYFYNNRGQQLEGDFKLRLPNDASLYYFAFGESAYEYRPMVDQLASRDFLAPELLRGSGTGPDEISRLRGGSWTKVKEARIVPREKAAHAYSETVRRRVDPALVEWAGAGVFNARVFPLLPGKLHRVVVGYDVNLPQDGDALTYALDLPQDISEVRVDLNVAAIPGAGAEVTPQVRPFMAGGRAYYHFEGPWTEPLVVRINTPGAMVLHGKDSQNNRFFATRVTPELPAEDIAAGAENAIFLVDTSLSSNPDKFNVWLKLLESTLTKNRDATKRFAVLFFNVESHWWQEKFVENNEENVQELLNYCHTLALEGATDLRQALTEATSPSWAENKEVPASPDLFLLSDGAVTWGEQNLHLLAQTLRSGSGGTLFAYQTGLSGTAVGVLEHLARESGGAVFSVAHEDEVEKAATAHRQRPWRLLDAAIPGGDDLLIAGRPKSIYSEQSLTIVGRGQPGNEVILRVARGEEEKTIRMPLSDAVESESAARLYGQVAVGQLEDLGVAVEDVAVAYARHFRVTGQTCSLLMLESEADYERFNIRPEDDAFVVKSSEAANVISNKLDELGDQLTDPKKALELWLAKMQNTPGVEFQLSTAMKLALERLPAKALEVKTPPLACKDRSRADLPKTVFEQLQNAQLDYDLIAAEAQRRFETRGAADALKALSSLVENNPGDPTLARDVAFSAMEWDLAGQAYWLLRRVADARPYEPQVYQALGQCAAEMDNADLAIIYYEVALGGRWHERYQDFNRIAGVEYLHLLRRIDRGKLSSNIPDYAKARMESLAPITNIDQADVLVTMMWNTDRTDVDLHVVEPTGETCYYQNRNTRSGGEITRDVTEGYGPEMYVMRNAPHGKFVVRADYYGSDANRTQVRSKVYLTIYEDFGGRKERVTRKTVPLSRGKELREVAEVFVEKE
jgi:hypothetical protein